jgi:hypothetical protein
MTVRRNFTVDTLTPLKDAGLVAVSAAAQVSSADQIVDLGAGFVEGNIVIDLTALEIDTADETYDIVAQLSPDADFGTAGNMVERLALHLGAKGTKRTDCDRDDVVGRYVLPFDNEFGGTVYRYLRLYTVVGGTIATGINYSGRLAKRIAG